MSQRAIVWFRKGLRLHDNPALLKSITLTEVLPLFVIDPRFFKSGRVSTNRLLFLLQALTDLNTSLKKLHSQLVVLQGDPISVISKLLRTGQYKMIAFERDTEPYAKIRDKEISHVASEIGVEVFSPTSHTLFDARDILSLSGGRIPSSYQSFLSVTKKLGPPRRPLPAPTGTLPPLPDPVVPLDLEVHRLLFPIELDTLVDSDIQRLHAENAFVNKYCGGESEALKRLSLVTTDKTWVCKFEKPKTSPAAFSPASTTVLSPYLKFGCLSASLAYYQFLFSYGETSYIFEDDNPSLLKEKVERFTQYHSQPPVSLEGQLLWREFFYAHGDGTPGFDTMEHNPLCLQVDWREGDEAAEAFNAWRDGRTGFPWIDALMLQLKTEGWMHHLGRHSVACFLTRGDLWVHWHKGRDVFDYYLLDSDWSLNNGNWLWLSASAFFSQYYRVYSPIAFPKKYDKNGEFVRHYLPILKNMPTKFIYEPWKAPIDVQQKAGCIIGRDYPYPIVDHDIASKQNIARMKRAYSEKRKGMPPSSKATDAVFVKKNEARGKKRKECT
mmetsp:Transcript_23971/g.60697  ORF Transcript_23971/g.60697 Transcript_23971/m.60697 type:complete len:553 (+) Transcript_23971:126-1784(+)